MESQDKLFEDFRAAAQADEEREFPVPDQLWARIERQLDNNEIQPKRFALRKVLYVAASLAVILGLSGAWFFSNTSDGITNNHSVASKSSNARQPFSNQSAENENLTIEAPANTVVFQNKVGRKIAASHLIANDAQAAAINNDVAPEPNPALSFKLEANTLPQHDIANNISNKAYNAIVLRSVSGVVVGRNGPVAGALVTVKDATQAVHADEKGNFTISIPADKTELIVSSFGAETKAVHLDNKESYTVLMNPDYKDIKVFSSITNNTQYKHTQANSNYGVIPQGILGRQTHSVTDILERTTIGIVPKKGTILPTIASGNAGIKDASAHSTDPLIIIDGVPFSGKFSDINPKSIKKIELLNESAGSALFGSKGKNGVIQITLKKGKKSKSAK